MIICPAPARDSVSTQHLIGMTDGQLDRAGRSSAGFSLGLSKLCFDENAAERRPAELPAMFTGKFPLPEATIYSRAVRFGEQADTHDLGIDNIWTTEPGITGNMVFDYAFADGGIFDPVAAWRMGSDFNLPLRGEYVPAEPRPLSPVIFFGRSAECRRSSM